MISLEKISLDQDSVFRNIPTCHPRKHLFNESINSPSEQDLLIDLANWTSGAEHSPTIPISGKKDSWYKYGDPENMGEFLFEKVNLPRSRFTDGSFPVWYGAQNVEISIEEITFHLEREARNELQHCSRESYIEFERAVCKAHIQSSNFGNGRVLPSVIPNYISLDSYPECISIANQLRNTGHDGIEYPSARVQGGLCYAVWNQAVIKKSNVINFYSIVVFKELAKDTLCYKHEQEES